MSESDFVSLPVCVFLSRTTRIPLPKGSGPSYGPSVPRRPGRHRGRLNRFRGRNRLHGLYGCRFTVTTAPPRLGLLRSRETRSLTSSGPRRLSPRHHLVTVPFFSADFGCLYSTRYPPMFSPGIRRSLHRTPVSVVNHTCTHPSRIPPPLTNWVSKRSRGLS